jgi:hypothetical protein
MALLLDIISVRSLEPLDVELVAAIITQNVAGEIARATAHKPGGNITIYSRDSPQVFSRVSARSGHHENDEVMS